MDKADTKTKASSEKYSSCQSKVYQQRQKLKGELRLQNGKEHKLRQETGSGSYPEPVELGTNNLCWVLHCSDQHTPVNV